jgi:hypothetical protein
MIEVKSKLEIILNQYKVKLEKRKSPTSLLEIDPKLAEPKKKKKTGKENTNSAIIEENKNDENEKFENINNHMEVEENPIPIQENVQQLVKQEPKHRVQRLTSSNKNKKEKVRFFHLINYFYIMRIFTIDCQCMHNKFLA